MTNLRTNILRTAGYLLVALLAGSALLHGLYRCGVLSPWPLLDMDRTILWQKIELADRGEPADLLLFGDSSCLMDVDARALGAAQGGVRVLNFGTVSHLSLASQMALLDRYLQHATTTPRRVVLLLHPDALRREEAVPAVESVFAAMQAGQVWREGRGLRARLDHVLGVDLLRQTLQARVLPVPILKGQGQRYGFTAQVREALRARDGSLTATGRYQWAAGQGRAVYRVAKSVQRDSAAWAARVPGEVQLAIGLSPLPESFAPTGYPEVARELPRAWADSFGRPVTVLELPPVLPDAQMADRLHANAEGQRAFTACLAEAWPAAP